MNQTRTGETAQRLVCAATAKLIDTVGGFESASEVAGIHANTLRKHCRTDEVGNITTCNAFRLSEFAVRMGERPVFYEMMLRELGYTVVKVPTVGSGADAVSVVSDLASAACKTTQECIDAIQDNHIDADEVERIGELNRTIQELAAQLNAAVSSQVRADVVNPFKRESAA